MNLYTLKMTNNITNITKYWISGFTQADGSFVVGFEKRNLLHPP